MQAPAEIPGLSAEQQQRRLRAITHSAQAMGACFLVFGLLAVMMALDEPRPIAMFIAASLASSGILFIVFASFLKRRRLWAWVATLIMTILILAAISILTLTAAVEMFRNLHRYPARELHWGMLGPLIWVGCWLAALILILRNLRLALPAIREIEATARKGFAVIPIARVAAIETGEETPGPQS